MQSIYHYSPWEWVQCLPHKEGEECNIQKYHIQEKGERDKPIPSSLRKMWKEVGQEKGS